MGTMHHHALIVTSWDNDLIADAHRVASGASPHVTPVIVTDVNGQASFAVLPDGSKEFWPESDLGDSARASIIKWLNDQAYEGGSNRIQWAEVSFGDLTDTLTTNTSYESPTA